MKKSKKRGREYIGYSSYFTIMIKIRTCLTVLAFLTLCSFSTTVNCAEKIVCCYYDISDGTSSDLTPERKSIIIEQLFNSEASIILLAGLKDQMMFDSILKDLKGFTFSKLLKNSNKSTFIAMISKIKPTTFEAVTDEHYNISKDVTLPVERGFIHAIFNIDGYIFHLFGANLKDRSKHPVYNQYDMRRYEARRLRALMTDVIKSDTKHPANVMLLAGLNDFCGKAPVTEIYHRRFGIEKRLFDLRPVDSLNVSWTNLNKALDEYERIDYIIISLGMMPEILLDETMIIENSRWNKASNHRPIIATILPVEKPLWEKDVIYKEFPYCIRSADFNIGQKRKRGSESAGIDL